MIDYVVCMIISTGIMIISIVDIHIYILYMIVFNNDVIIYQADIFHLFPKLRFGNAKYEKTLF